MLSIPRVLGRVPLDQTQFLPRYRGGSWEHLKRHAVVQNWPKGSVPLK